MAKKTNKAVENKAIEDLMGNAVTLPHIIKPVGSILPTSLEDTLLIQGLIKRIQELEEKLLAIESSVVRLSLYPIAVPAYTPGPIVTCIGDNTSEHIVTSTTEQAIANGDLDL